MTLISWQFFILCLLTVLVYYLLGRLIPDYQWLVLLAASIVFYVWVSPKLALYLLVTIVLTWFLTIQIGKKEISEELRKILFIICLIIDIGILAVLKYAGFFAGMLFSKGLTGFAVPLGISFYTFQSVAYCADVYRGEIQPEKNLMKFALFVSFFPHISQGPIAAYSRLAPQLYSYNSYNPDNLKYGAERALLGVFKKLVIANNLGAFVDSIYINPEEFSGFVLSAAAVCYTLQIYLDFSGYMDIACGVSKCLGIELDENFRTPYFSRSETEFWRRWHITLSGFFTKYIYIPLGGSRKGKLRTFLNTMIVFLISGLWHGADWSFVLWGAYHGLFVASAKLLGPFYISVEDRLKINTDAVAWKAFQILRTFAIVCIGWIFFRADSISQAFLIIRRIFTRNFYFGWSWGLVNRSFDYFYWIGICTGLILLLILELVETKECFTVWLQKRKLPLRWIVIYSLLVPVIFVALLSSNQHISTGNFIYFNF